MTTNIFLLFILVLLLVNIWLAYKAFNKKDESQSFMQELLRFRDELSKTDPLIRNEFKNNREELQTQLSASRGELSNSFNNLNDTIAKTLKNFEEKISKNMTDLQESQRRNITGMLNQQEQLKAATESKLEKIRDAVEQKLDSIQKDNAEKLESMRQTVDEKLQNTLEKRLGESFKLVSDRLEQVHKGLGEMQNLANGVGDLKKVLSNVKTRGILGEVQLGAILETILAPEQYEKNVATKKGSRENVEYAIRLPGKDEEGNVVYLPIDSKFPTEAYHMLMEAYDTGNTELIKTATKAIETEIKRCAKDIRDKYINPPDTTDFGLMFLPFEGLYAEVARNTFLLETLQRDYKIIITGPTTLAALLNSLQMGFRTLVIEKRTSEVWKVLGAVKTEFNKFNDVLKKAQLKIANASKDIDQLVGTRTDKIQLKLRNIETLSGTETNLLLNNEPTDSDDSNDTDEG